MEELIAKRYVAALLESKVDLKEIEDILSSLENIILNDKKVKEVIYSPLIKSSQKYELLIAPIEKKLSKEMKNFFKVLAQKD
ncbi:MAG: F0F1 ATP synthase subunit delta, partial [Epsilonproteobacteria bacterium]|nr:F0F1 ATP synthase subunit delta [Campylobacterota bacterium]